MPQSKLNLFAQLLERIDRSSFKKLVKKNQSDKHAKGISTWTHFVSMVFATGTFRLLTGYSKWST